jgi:hypothetical protein
MARAAKKTAKKKNAPKSTSKAAKKITRPVKKVTKKATRKVAPKKVAAKKIAKKKRAGVKTVRTTAGSLVQSARVHAAAAAEAGKDMMKRAIDAVAEVAAPLIPGSTGDKPKDD